jgi:anti-anti-sigma factor
MSLTINQRERDGVTILDLDGRIVIGAAVGKLCAAVRRIMSEGREKVIFNLSGVHHIDSLGLDLLIACHVSAGMHSAQLKLLEPRHEVAEVFAITKLDKRFEIFDREVEALESFPKEVALCSSKAVGAAPSGAPYRDGERQQSQTTLSPFALRIRYSQQAQ